MLDPEATWVDEFKKLKPADTPIAGIMALADTIEKLTNKVEPNLPTATVLPGTFKWNKAIFIAQMMSLAPTQTPDWIQKVASAWQAACTAGVITPGTVKDPMWTVSQVDVNTLPVAATTIPTISAGMAAIIGAMSVVPALMQTSPDAANEAFAKAFFAGVSAFTFALIGIAGSPPTPAPLPVVAPAK